MDLRTSFFWLFIIVQPGIICFGAPVPGAEALIVIEEVEAGSNVNFTCPQQPKERGISWKMNQETEEIPLFAYGVRLTSDKRFLRFHQDSRSLTITNVTMEDSLGNYSCYYPNKNGSGSEVTAEHVIVVFGLTVVEPHVAEPHVVEPQLETTRETTEAPMTIVTETPAVIPSIAETTNEIVTSKIPDMIDDLTTHSTSTLVSTTKETPKDEEVDESDDSYIDGAEKSDEVERNSLEGVTQREAILTLPIREPAKESDDDTLTSATTDDLTTIEITSTTSTATSTTTTSSTTSTIEPMTAELVTSGSWILSLLGADEKEQEETTTEPVKVQEETITEAPAEDLEETVVNDSYQDGYEKHDEKEEDWGEVRSTTSWNDHPDEDGPKENGWKDRVAQDRDVETEETTQTKETTHKTEPETDATEPTTEQTSHYHQDTIWPVTESVRIERNFRGEPSHEISTESGAVETTTTTEEPIKVVSITQASTENPTTGTPTIAEHMSEQEVIKTTESVTATTTNATTETMSPAQSSSSSTPPLEQVFVAVKMSELVMKNQTRYTEKSGATGGATLTSAVVGLVGACLLVVFV